MMKEQMVPEKSNATQDMSQLKDVLNESEKLIYVISESLGVPLTVGPVVNPIDPKEGIVPDIERCLKKAKVVRDELQSFIAALGENRV